MDIRFPVLLGIVLNAQSSVYAFGQDVCFEPISGTTVNKIVNCIGVGELCRTSHLTPILQGLCRLAATGDSLSGLNGSTVVGGRSLVHTDATYVMAQLIGYTPWQAYQMAIYSEATDQSYYTPFDQNGNPLLSSDTIASCQEQWGSAMDNACLLTTPQVNGLSRFDADSGGMWLHLHARYSVDGQMPPRQPFPVDYLSPEYAQSEKLLNDFHAWVFDDKSTMCVYGLTQDQEGNPADCASSSEVINSSISFTAVGLEQLKIPFVTSLGTFRINDTDHSGQNPVLATDDSLQAYLTPQDADYAKMGMFVHTLGDRYSHHMCIDRSYFFQTDNHDYQTSFDTVYCAQGSHFLWHVWEQGTTQNQTNLDSQFQTMRPALEAMYTQLLMYAQHKNIEVNTQVDREEIIDKLISVVEIYDPAERLSQMVQLMEAYQILPMPGHGSVADLSNEEWLSLAGAPLKPV